MSFFLYTFTESESMFFLSITRIGCGFFQVFFYILFPVWVDQFGVYDLRTYWITFLQVGVPLGTMIGYVSEALFINFTSNVSMKMLIKYLLVEKRFLFTNVSDVKRIGNFNVYS